MATTTLTFGKGYDNGRKTIWSWRRQVLTLPLNTDTSGIFKAPNRPISSLTSIKIPVKSGEIIPANKIYDNIKVVIFKGFNASYIGTSNAYNWFDFYSNSRYGLAKHTNDDEGWFNKANVNTFMTTPLAYFSGSITVTGAATESIATFTNPTFTDAGKSLANWYVSTTDDNKAQNRLYVGFYHDSDTNWTNAGGKEATINWISPANDPGTELTLGYSAGATVKYYDGSTWKDCEVYYHTGSGWQQCEVQYHDGSNWKIIGG